MKGSLTRCSQGAKLTLTFLLCQCSLIPNRSPYRKKQVAMYRIPSPFFAQQQQFFLQWVLVAPELSPRFTRKKKKINGQGRSLNCIIIDLNTLTYLITNPDEIQSLSKMSFTDFTFTQIFFCICNPKERRRKGICKRTSTQHICRIRWIQYHNNSNK